MLLETYGSADRTLDASAAIHVCEAGEVYARDDYVYWGFTAEGLRRLAHHAGYEGFELFDAPVIDGHPRVIGTLRAPSETVRSRLIAEKQARVRARRRQPKSQPVVLLQAVGTLSDQCFSPSWRRSP